MKQSLILIPVLLSAFLFVGQRAVVAEPTVQDGVRTEIVRYRDLDLTSPAGAAALDSRIAQAIRHVCDGGNVRDLSAMQEEQRCRNQARLAANSQRRFAMARANAGAIQLSSGR